MVFYERASGSRMHAAYFRPGGVHQDIDQKLVDDIGTFIPQCLQTIENLDQLLTENRIFKQRNVDISVVSSTPLLSIVTVPDDSWKSNLVIWMFWPAMPLVLAMKNLSAAARMVAA
eukprot:gene4533-biopygen3776